MKTLLLQPNTVFESPLELPDPSILHAFVFHALAKVDLNLKNELYAHDPKPFAVRTAASRRNQRQDARTMQFGVAVLQETYFEVFALAFMPGRTLGLFNSLNVGLVETCHAQIITESSLQDAPNNKHEMLLLETLSPTVFPKFHVGELLEVEAVLHGLHRRWCAFGGEALIADKNEWAKHVEVVDQDLRPVRQGIRSNGTQVAVGAVRGRVLFRIAPTQVGAAANLLLRWATRAGLGSRLSYGFGEVRLRV